MFKKLCLTLALLPMLSLAHSVATMTTPANGAVLKRAPTQFMLMFNEASTLTKLSLVKSGIDSETELGPLPKDPTQHFMVPAPKLEPGEYTLRYRAVGADGHVMPGVVKFTISAN